MSRIDWSSEYSVNIDTIDKQHMYLFDLCNMLYKLIDQTESSQSEDQALKGLRDYIEIHFNDEEKYYKDHPMFNEHHLLHQDFVKQVNSYIADFNKGSLQLKELADFVQGWLIEHIVVIDGQYFRDITKQTE